MGFRATLITDGKVCLDKFGLATIDREGHGHVIRVKTEENVEEAIGKGTFVQSPGFREVGMDGEVVMLMAGSLRGETDNWALAENFVGWTGRRGFTRLSTQEYFEVGREIVIGTSGAERVKITGIV